MSLDFVVLSLVVVVSVTYGLLAALAREKMISRPRVMTWMRRAFAGSFVVLAAKLALEER